jgi:predicted MPP superfamily phosphohydrolase
MKIIAIVFFIIISAITYLIGSLSIPFLAKSFDLRLVLWIVHSMLSLTLILGPIIPRLKGFNFKNSFFQIIQWTSYHLLGFYFLFFFLLIFRKPVLAIFPILDGDSIYVKSVFGISIVATFIGYLIAQKCPSVLNVKIPVKNLSKKLIGFRIVQLSDIHVSSTIKADFVEQIVEITNKLNPDLIAITGDVIDGTLEQLKDEVAGFSMLRSKYGVYYCPGNHEYYWGLEEWLNEFRELNFNVLINQHKIIDVEGEKVVIAGVHDLASNRMNVNYKCDPELALKNTPKDAFKILLAHQPHTIKKMTDSMVDLMLSGHTHAGQFFPSTLLIYFFQSYVKGLHRVKNVWLYINQGTGYWGPPNRFGTKSEITLIELVDSKE